MSVSLACAKQAAFGIREDVTQNAGGESSSTIERHTYED